MNQFLLLADVIKSPVELDNLRELISGMEDDLYNSEYQTFEDLRRYCYRVASTVGLCLERYMVTMILTQEGMLWKWEYIYKWSMS